ncbi:hypothetical protein QW060_27860 [Myroides ceti]|uniref:Uncharacterized protein n=1 Tax=Paenimyroides ceti TaxID=395087 RepID=A0ABT8D171_9FLAO|nr:hypothetical protein [Paenimyroides ceti]MDN3710598.1 hypothetical protein [Paenimyroides ceti]
MLLRFTDHTFLYRIWMHGMKHSISKKRQIIYKTGTTRKNL